MKRLLALLVVAVAGACAGPGAGLRPGVAGEAQVRERMGEPALVLADPDGGRFLAYTTGPSGVQTWLARIAPDGKLASIDQVLQESWLRRIRPGTTTGEEVLRLIGPPWRKVAFGNLRQVAWDYRYRDAWGYDVDYSVMLGEDGVVASVANVRVESGRGDMGR